MVAEHAFNMLELLNSIPITHTQKIDRKKKKLKNQK